MTAMSIEERVAVLEEIARRNEIDKNGLFKLIRDHMIDEEKDRKDMLDTLTTFKAYLRIGVVMTGVLWTVTTTLIIIFKP